MSNICEPEISTASVVAEIVGPDTKWYALKTQSRHEKQVRDRLEAMGVEPLLPLTKQRRQWSDRKVWTILPLFSGYCFARFSLVHSLPILQTPGVVRIVGSSQRPEAIPTDEISALQKLAASDRVMEPYDYFTEGMWVEVIRGPLIGLRGHLVRKTSHDGLVIRAHLIQQAALIHINADEVTPLQ
jgi:transcription antitermination factor NusG